MGLTVDTSAARDKLVEALAIANSGKPLPSEWLENTTEVGDAPSRTYVAALGTALLARATDEGIDPLSLKATDATGSYSARMLCHNVLVPASVEFGFHLGATGREPMNNQPFFRYNRIDEAERVRDRASYDRLIEIIGSIALLDEASATTALAAFLRVRLEAAVAARRIEYQPGSLDPLAVSRIIEFVRSGSEGGRRGQAFGAAVYDLMYPTVRMGRVNDPSVRFPGDVQALTGATVIDAAEIRQKSVPEHEVYQFAELLRRAEVARGRMVMLAADQSVLSDDLPLACWERFGVLVRLDSDPQDLLLSAIHWSRLPLESALEKFPEHFINRLREIEADPRSIAELADIRLRE